MTGSESRDRTGADDGGTETAGSVRADGDTGSDESAEGGEWPNLLLVVVDCLREDFLPAERTQTPYLDGLRERGLACTECYASATTTTPAVASLLTGTYAERNGVQSLNRGTLSPDVPTLPAVLDDHGYHTEAMVTGPLVPETGLDRGFDRYDCRAEDRSLFGDWADRATERLATLPEPFAAVVHLWELHEDVTVPAEYDRPAYGETPYGRALSALDPEIEALAAAVPEETLVAVVGDHGESVTYRHSPLRLALKSLRDALRSFAGVDTRPVAEWINQARDGDGPAIDDHYIENGHGENVFDFTTNVPFVLAGPGVEPATVTTQVRQIDVLPTLLWALGVEAETDGEAVVPDGVEERVAYMRACGASLHGERNWARAVRAEDAKYVEYPDRDWDPGVYDLTASPRELERVDDPDLAADLRALLPAEGVDPTEAERLGIEDRLADLGYR